MMQNLQILMVWGRLTKPHGPSRAQGSALTRNEMQDMARRTCFREQYYTGTRGITQPGKIACRQDPRENMYNLMTAFSLISQDWLIRLGSRLALHEILSVCFSGLQRGHPENQYEREEVFQGLVHDTDF